MANRPVPDTVAINVRGTLLGQQVENTFYGKYIAVPDETELQDLADAVADYWVENAIQYLPAGWLGREVYVRDLSAPITVQATSLGILGEVGGLTGDTLPSLSTKAFARRSGLTGRSSRGRIYWMGLSEAYVSLNLVGTELIGLIIDALEGLDTLLSTAGYTPVIVSRVQNGVVLTTPQTYPVTGWITTALDVDTRRSRKPGKGS